MLGNLQNYSPKEIEERVLKFWEEKKIFEKSLKKPKSQPYSFYDGPPFASGKPHYGHILATTIKDTVTRFWTMKGYRVERRVGWDCHGLPVENLIEKELGLKDKRAIEKLGIEKFNHACRASVFRSVDDFERTIKRAGRWADYANSYATLDNSYIESVWWVFKKLWEAGLVYKDFRVSPYCPRCGTPLSNFEVNQGYKDVEDASLYLKFKAKGEKKEKYFLVWTTTPWTLSGNVALAVGKDINYVEVSYKGERLILAKDRLSVLNGEYKVLSEFKGKKLEGLEYDPLFKLPGLKNNSGACRVLTADFVSTEDGSGIVHIAPAFGEDDNKLIKAKTPELLKNFEALVTVDENGAVKKGFVGEGLFVKKADPLIVENLQKRGLFYKTEKITHSYPFCWRCDTPLLYYPVESWYVKTTNFKKNLIANNKSIRWVPGHVKEGRFGNWLKEVRDWAISRNRFWGAALPVWQCGDCKKYVPVGSMKELSDLSEKSGNKYFILRHGQSQSNSTRTLSSYPEKFEMDLTAGGKSEVKKILPGLKREQINLIFSSDILRAKSTAKIVAEELKLKVNYDKRLREYDFGVLNGRPYEEFTAFIGDSINRLYKKPEKGETLTEVRARMVDLVLELEKKYKNKNILLVSHGDPLWVLEGTVQGLDEKGIMITGKNYIKTGELRKLEFLKLPYDKTGKADLHRPFIDKSVLKCPHCGGKAKRIEQVFDCWFESGAMPYGQWHYPFENKKLVEKTFPADFIAEGLDQTRGWFYTLHVLASALTLKNIGLGKNKPAFKNVIVNGLILAEDGQKLSKKLRNYTEPEIVFEKFGADALRYFLLSSTPIGEDYRFSDKGVQEVKNKVIDRFINSYKFYELYADKRPATRDPRPANILDQWILARLDETILKMTGKMESYELTDAARELMAFLDDLSNWYIRRSRRRLQKSESAKDFSSASQTLKFCLLESAKLMAPFAPFISEAVYKSLAGKKGKESVHLENWPPIKSQPKSYKLKAKSLFEGMAEIRKLASLALAKRAEAKIKVRQPLASLKIKSKISNLKNKELLNILAEEVNVKKIIFNPKLKKEAELDTYLTQELIEEGILRDVVRLVQGLRQEAGYSPKDLIALFIETEEARSAEIETVLNKYLAQFKKEIGAKSVEFRKTDKFDAEIETQIDVHKIRAAVRKI